MKNVFTKENIFTAVGIIVVVLSIIFYPSVKKDNAVKKESDVPMPVQMANPASQYCVMHGYVLKMRKDEGGGDVGYCIFPDGNECEEWKFFRNECGGEWKTKREENILDVRSGWIVCLVPMCLKTIV
jgi:putative hemolysin